MGGVTGEGPTACVCEHMTSISLSRDAPLPQQKERVVIVGAGVIGLTTAYCLSRATKRYDIHIVDHREKPAAGCSYQNGGVINVESITPVNAYMSPPKSIWASLQYRLQGKPTNTMITWRALAEPGLFHWCWYFYRNTSPESIQANSKKMLAL